MKHPHTTKHALPDVHVDGIDVSQCQGSIDWPAVVAAGFEFAWLRSSIGSKKDTLYDEHRSGCGRAGLRRWGAYHAALPGGSARKEAEDWARHAGELPEDGLPPALDIEVQGLTNDWVAEVLGRAEELFGRRCVVYSGLYFWRGLDPKGEHVEPWAARPFWLAQYTQQVIGVPLPWREWAFWQYSGDGGERVPGVKVDCDRNVFAGDLAALDALIEASVISPIPPTLPCLQLPPVVPVEADPDARAVIAEIFGYDRKEVAE